MVQVCTSLLIFKTFIPVEIKYCVNAPKPWIYEVIFNGFMAQYLIKTGAKVLNFSREAQTCTKKIRIWKKYIF